MKRFVLDASVSLAWFVDNPVPELAIRIKKALETGSTALVPALWHLEMANGLALAERRGKILHATIDRAIDDVERLLVAGIQTSATVVSVRYAHLAARNFALTSYDAVYLETARLEGLPLVTFDEALRRAATKAGVALIR